MGRMDLRYETMSIIYVPAWYIHNKIRPPFPHCCNSGARDDVRCMLPQTGLLLLQGVCWRGLLQLGPATDDLQPPGVEVVLQIMVIVATNGMWCDIPQV
jgi:hypothetical protein